MFSLMRFLNKCLTLNMFNHLSFAESFITLRNQKLSEFNFSEQLSDLDNKLTLFPLL